MGAHKILAVDLNVMYDLACRTEGLAEQRQARYTSAKRESGARKKHATKMVSRFALVPRSPSCIALALALCPAKTSVLQAMHDQ